MISIFKIALPTLTVIVLVLSGFHSQNFGSNIHEFMPYGTRSIFEATSVSGIIMSYDAFQTVINMGGELKNPRKNIVRGVIISMLITTAIYVLLQVTFIGAIEPSTLQKVGWHGINFTSPFADIAIILGINWLVILLYMDAFVSPFGTGVAFVATASRALAAMTHTKHLPNWLGRLNRKYMIPRFAMIADLILAVILVSVFRNWNLLATVIAASTLIAYLTGPVTTIALRKIAHNLKRPFGPKYMVWLAPTAFVLTSLAIYWSMWPTTIQVISVITLGLPVYIYYEIRYQHSNLKDQLKHAWWLIVYMIFISVMSYVGSTGFGGRDFIKYPLDFVVIIVASLLFYWWGVKSSRTEIDSYAKKVNERVND